VGNGRQTKGEKQGKKCKKKKKLGNGKGCPAGAPWDKNGGHPKRKKGGANKKKGNNLKGDAHQKGRGRHTAKGLKRGGLGAGVKGTRQEEKKLGGDTAGKMPAVKRNIKRRLRGGKKNHHGRGKKKLYNIDQKKKRMLKYLKKRNFSARKVRGKGGKTGADEKSRKETVNSNYVLKNTNKGPAIIGKTQKCGGEKKKTREKLEKGKAKKTLGNAGLKRGKAKNFG